MENFEYISKHWDNHKNFELLLQLYDQGQKKNDMSIVPFIGAGLSAFCYPTWGRVLEQLIEDFGGTGKHKITKQLKRGNFEKVADMLSKKDERQFYIEFREIYGLDKLYKYLTLLHKQAIGLLPFLFPSSLIITTNFDPIIEAVYDSVDLATLEIFTNPEILTEPNNQYKLLKIHGDVNSGNDNIIFSKKSYMNHYKRNSVLVKNLGKLFKNRSMLFLGASLYKDRTLNVLKQIGGDRPHFAILECDWTKEAFDKRKSELSKLGILPIFYPAGKYQYVYIILNELLKRLNPSGIIESRNGMKFYRCDEFVTRILNNIEEEKQLEKMRKEYERYTPDDMMLCLNHANWGSQIYLENNIIDNDIDLLINTANNLLLLTRWNYLGLINVNEYYNPLSLLKKLIEKTPNYHVIRIYAECLTWNSHLHEFEQITLVVDELGRLYRTYVCGKDKVPPMLQDVSLFFAGVLSRLICILLWKNYDECEKHISELATIYNKFNSLPFALIYSEALWCIHLGELQKAFSIVTDKANTAKDTLAELLRIYNYNDNLLSIYARMLINEINAQEIENAENTMSELFNLFIERKTDDIAIWCAQGLTSISLKYKDDFDSRQKTINTLFQISQEYKHIPIITAYHRRAYIAFKLRLDDLMNYESDYFDPGNPWNILNTHIDLYNGKTVNLTPWWSKDEKKLKKIMRLTIVLLIPLSISFIFGIIYRLSWLWIGSIVLICIVLAINTYRYFKILSESFDKMLFQRKK